MSILTSLWKTLFPKRALEEAIATHLIATQVGFGEFLSTAIAADFGSDDLLGQLRAELASCLITGTTMAVAEAAEKGSSPLSVRNILASFVVRYAQGIAKLDSDGQQMLVKLATEHYTSVEELLPENASATGDANSRALLVGALVGVSFGRLGRDVSTTSRCANLRMEASDQQIQYCNQTLTLAHRAT